MQTAFAPSIPYRVLFFRPLDIFLPTSSLSPGLKTGMSYDPFAPVSRASDDAFAKMATSIFHLTDFVAELITANSIPSNDVYVVSCVCSLSGLILLSLSRMP